MLCIPDRNWRCEGWSLRGGRHGSWWCAAVGRWVFFFWRLWLWDQHVHLEQRRIRWAWLAPSKRKLQRSPWTECRPHHTHTIWSALFLFYTFSKIFHCRQCSSYLSPKKTSCCLTCLKREKKKKDKTLRTELIQYVEEVLVWYQTCVLTHSFL